ncbi:hypothetical protein PR048_019218 [Dryococelus australis]|uniref:Uncharacterized protein n=1 Tax=Dryococelus australis TaxID=614101 RepID=A0ABQ9H2Y5_9NEOP|nr:hypothetical protein PR048_019218 [Dryococelus australis]
MVAPLIEKNTDVRGAITPHERLRLEFSTIISPQTLGGIIEETCIAIYKILKREYCKVGNNVLTPSLYLIITNKEIHEIEVNDIDCSLMLLFRQHIELEQYLLVLYFQFSVCEEDWQMIAHGFQD